MSFHYACNLLQQSTNNNIITNVTYTACGNCEYYLHIICTMQLIRRCGFGSHRCQCVVAHHNASAANVIYAKRPVWLGGVILGLLTLTLADDFSHQFSVYVRGSFVCVSYMH